jgi:hypothetical protein
MKTKSSAFEQCERDGGRITEGLEGYGKGFRVCLSCIGDWKAFCGGVISFGSYFKLDQSGCALKMIIKNQSGSS